MCARVVSVPSGHELGLADGRICRLAGVLAPKQAQEFNHFAPSLPPNRWAEAATRYLVDATSTGRAHLWGMKPAADAYGRLLAQAEIAGQWLQGGLIENGLGRVYPLAGLEDGITAALLGREQQARADRLGVWNDPAFAPKATAHDIERAAVDGALGGYVLVQGIAGPSRPIVGGLAFSLRLRDGAEADVRLQERGSKRKGAAMFAPPEARDLLEVRGRVEVGAPLEINVAHRAQIAILARP